MRAVPKLPKADAEIPTLFALSGNDEKRRIRAHAILRVTSY